jgi:hypothetical protein
MSKSLIEENPLARYSQPDETVYAQCCRLETDVADRICAGARRLARTYFQCPDREFDKRLGGRWNIRILREELAPGSGTILMLGECCRIPPQLTVYTAIVRIAAARLSQISVCPEAGHTWHQVIEKAVLAHELFHFLAHAGQGKEVELAAHSFTRELLGLTFSPLLFESALRKKVEERKAEIPSALSGLAGF